MWLDFNRLARTVSPESTSVEELHPERSWDTIILGDPPREGKSIKTVLPISIKTLPWFLQRSLQDGRLNVDVPGQRCFPAGSCLALTSAAARLQHHNPKTARKIARLHGSVIFGVWFPRTTYNLAESCGRPRELQRRRAQ